MRRVAVVGAGPSGIYVADALTSDKQPVPVAVDIIERLPVPFGLVRYGVAPDHATIKLIRHALDKVLRRPDVRFLGGIEVGRDVSVDTLHEHYDAVVLAYGASEDRKLDIPGEDLPGSIAARRLVTWYCGHPDAHEEVVLDALRNGSTAVVVGMGNVAVDVARVLARRRVDLEVTDMPQHVIDELDRTTVMDIHMVGRRGPAQAAFTTKELRELGEMPGVDVVVDPADLELDPLSAEQVESSNLLRRNVEVLREWSTRTPTGAPRRIHLHFLARPVRILGDARVTGVEIERTRLDESLAAVGTGETYEIPADLVVTSAGYRGEPMDQVPFDERRGVVPHSEGHVLHDGVPVPWEFVVGWLKRGPSGVIGTNKKDATDTVQVLLRDIDDLPVVDLPPPDALPNLLRAKGVQVVTIEGWSAIDAAEIRLGASRGRERTTLHERAALLAAAQAEAEAAAADDDADAAVSEQA